MPVGYWCPVLHAHLPYVRHPEYPAFLEEDWFFEALNETYVPLVRVLDGLLRDGVDYRLTMTLSPPLVSMMTDELLVRRYRGHLDRLVELVAAGDRAHRALAAAASPSSRASTTHEFPDIRRIFRDDYGSRHRCGAFRKHRDAGKLEIITCGATHGFLPLMDPVPQAVRAQVQVAAQHYRQHFGRDPRGSGCPECGYLPGPRGLPARGRAPLRLPRVARPARTPTRGRASASTRPSCRPGGIVFFGRDMESSRQVWSAESGYPGDFDYREFYKDVGWELPMEYLEEFLPDGLRKNLGHQVLPRHRPRHRSRAQAAVRARLGAREGGAATRATSCSNRQKQVAAPRGRPTAARRSW